MSCVLLANVRMRPFGNPVSNFVKPWRTVITSSVSGTRRYLLLPMEDLSGSFAPSQSMSTSPGRYDSAEKWLETPRRGSFTGRVWKAGFAEIAIVLGQQLPRDFQYLEYTHRGSILESFLIRTREARHIAFRYGFFVDYHNVEMHKLKV